MTKQKVKDFIECVIASFGVVACSVVCVSVLDGDREWYWLVIGLLGLGLYGDWLRSAWRRL